MTDQSQPWGQQPPPNSPYDGSPSGPGGPGGPQGPGGPGNPQGPGGTSSRTLLVIAAVVVVIVLVVVAATVLLSGGDDDDKDSAADPTETSQAPQPTESTSTDLDPQTSGTDTPDPESSPPEPTDTTTDEPSGPVAFHFPGSVDGRRFIVEESVANGDASSTEYRSSGFYKKGDTYDFALYQYFPDGDLESDYTEVGGPDGLVKSKKVDDALCYKGFLDSPACAIAFKGGTLFLAGDKEQTLKSFKAVVASLHALVEAVE